MPAPRALTEPDLIPGQAWDLTIPGVGQFPAATLDGPFHDPDLATDPGNRKVWLYTVEVPSPDDAHDTLTVDLVRVSANRTITTLDGQPVLATPAHPDTGHP